MGDEDALNIKLSGKNQPHNIKKIHAHHAYLVEFDHDLDIQASMNVSSNPGFESFVGVF